MEKLKKRKKSGFTLIEMIVVIAIVVIIAAIAIPQALKAVNKSRASTDLANARTYAGQIMTRLANAEVLKGTDNSKNIVVSDTVQTVAKAHIGSDPETSKLDKGKVFGYKYIADTTNGDDQIEIYIGGVKVYPKVADKSAWAPFTEQVDTASGGGGQTPPEGDGN